MNKVGKVRMAKLELELDDDDDDDGRQEEEDQKLWCVEIEMGNQQRKMERTLQRSQRVLMVNLLLPLQLQPHLNLKSRISVT